MPTPRHTDPPGDNLHRPTNDPELPLSYLRSDVLTAASDSNVPIPVRDILWFPFAPTTFAEPDTPADSDSRPDDQPHHADSASYITRPGTHHLDHTRVWLLRISRFPPSPDSHDL